MYPGRPRPESLHVAIDPVANSVMKEAGVSYSGLSSTKGHMTERIPVSYACNMNEQLGWGNKGRR